MITTDLACDPDTAPSARLEQLAALILYLQEIFATANLDEERFHAIFLDGGRSYLDDCVLGSGQSAHLTIELRELFARALALGARFLIVAHNHPSGNCRPSESDILATRRVAQIGRALGIELLDHLILTREKLYSMRAGGRL